MSEKDEEIEVLEACITERGDYLRALVEHVDRGKPIPPGVLKSARYVLGMPDPEDDPPTAPADRVTAEELADVARLDAAATPGPWARAWYEDGDEGEGPFGVYPGARGEMVESNDVITAPCDEHPEGTDVGYARSGHDAAFIAVARALLPRLAAEVTALRAERAAVGAKLDRLRRSVGRQVESARDGRPVSADALAAVEHDLRAEVDKTT